MNKTHALLALLFCLPATSFFAQTEALQLTLRYLPDEDRWGVFLKTDASISPSASTVTGSGQVTVVMPVNFPWGNLTSHAGTWHANAIVHGPDENPGRTYTSFGLLTDSPNPIVYSNTSETLLFSFKKQSDCPDTMYLFKNNTDLFEQPNSIGSNPGISLSVVDFGYVPFKFYSYKDNYDPSAWNCNPAPNPCAEPLQFQLQPASVTVCSFSSHVFTGSVANPAGDILQYQWQTSADGGITWAAVPNSPTFAGAQTNQLSIFSVADLDNRHFRLGVNMENCQASSDAAVLEVDFGNDCVVLPGIPNGGASGGGGINWDKPMRENFGVGMQEEQVLLNVFPNPARQAVFVKFHTPVKSGQAVLRLWNVQGVAMRQALTSENEAVHFDLGDFAPGLYLLTFEVDGKILKQEKFVIK